MEAKTIVELILATVIEDEDLRIPNAIHNRRSASAGGSIFQFDAGSSSTHFIDGVGSSGSGRGEFDLVWQADQQAWLPLRAEGYIAATPEPATLLLWSTGAAGLGLARWYRRRGRERVHAA